MDAIKQVPQVDPVEFALALYRRFAKADDPVLLSPLSVSLAIRALGRGARGETAAGIAGALAGGVQRGEGESSGDDLDRLRKFGDPTMSLAISLWLGQQMVVDPSFAVVMKEDPLIHWSDVDFAQAEAARTRINAWTEERTEGRIRNLLSPGSIDATTRLVLTSALQFHAEWSDRFDNDATARLPFTRADGTQVQTSMMRSTMETRFVRGEDCRMLELRYLMGGAFHVLLPDSPSGLERLEAQLTPTVLRGLTDSLETCEVDIGLPKFTQEVECDLRTGLSALGMASAFDPARADFSGIGSSPDGLPIFLSKAVHRTFIDVNERDTKAAAASSFFGETATEPMPPPPRREEFHADHPFLYMIRRGRSILFIGRMTGR